MAMEVVKQPFAEYQNYFMEEDPRKYFVSSSFMQECVFYARIAQKYRPFEFENQYEEEVYQKSLKKLIRFSEVDNLVSKLHDFTWNFVTMYEDIQRNITNNNFLSRKTEVTDVHPSIMSGDAGGHQRVGE